MIRVPTYNTHTHTHTHTHSLLKREFLLVNKKNNYRYIIKPLSILDDGFFVAKNFFKNVSMIKLFLIVMTIAMISLNIFSFEGYCDSKGTNTADLAPIATDIDKPISNEERYKDSQGEAPNLKEMKEPVSGDEKK